LIWFEKTKKRFVLHGVGGPVAVSKLGGEGGPYSPRGVLKYSLLSPHNVHCTVG